MSKQRKPLAVGPPCRAAAAAANNSGKCMARQELAGTWARLEATLASSVHAKARATRNEGRAATLIHADVRKGHGLNRVG